MEFWVSLRFSKFFSLVYGKFKKGFFSNRDKFVDFFFFKVTFRKDEVAVTSFSKDNESDKARF